VKDTPTSLAAIRTRLRELLGLLDDDGADAASLERALGECARTFEALRATPNDAAGAAHEDELEQTLRLNTVVLSRVQTEIESLARGIRQAKQARRHVDSRGTAGVTGTSCDISG
jgi:hypothetical protein